MIIGDGGNEEGVEDDFTNPQAEWSAYRDLAFGQASFVIMNETVAEWAWKADDGTPLDAVRLLHLLCFACLCCPIRNAALVCRLLHVGAQSTCDFVAWLGTILQVFECFAACQCLFWHHLCLAFCALPMQ